jgi:hypothetical protein
MRDNTRISASFIYHFSHICSRGSHVRPEVVVGDEDFFHVLRGNLPLDAACDNQHQNCNLRTKHLGNGVRDTAVFGKTGAQFILDQTDVRKRITYPWVLGNSQY